MSDVELKKNEDSLFLLNKEQYHLASHCFDANSPNIAFIQSIMENKIPGQIFVDCLKNPQAACVFTEGPYGFVSKNFTFDKLQALEALITNKNTGQSNFKLMMDSSEILMPANSENITAIGRSYMKLNREKMRKDVVCPEGFSLHFIDNILFEKGHWKELMRSIYGTRQNYLAHAAGYCLMHNNKVVSEAHAVISNDFAELGVVTDPLYRKLGLSTIVCHSLILYCLDRGFQAKWSCDSQNEASLRLAVKLGFENTYQYHALMKIPDEFG